MIDITLNLLLFFVLSLVYFYSLSGYGKLIANSNSNFFELQLNGTIILLLIAYAFYLSIGFSYISNIITIIVGLVLNFKLKKKFISIKFKYLILLFLFLFTVLIISKTHDDFNSYHYFSINEIFNNGLRLGVSILNDRFFHSSLFSLNQALLILPYFNFKLVHIPSFLIFFCTIGYFITICFSSSNTKEVFFSILSLLILLVKFND